MPQWYASMQVRDGQTLSVSVPKKEHILLVAMCDWRWGWWLKGRPIPEPVAVGAACMHGPSFINTCLCLFQPFPLSQPEKEPHPWNRLIGDET